MSGASLRRVVLTKLPPDDSCAAQRLATDTLRGMEVADRLLRNTSRNNPPLTRAQHALAGRHDELCQGGAVRMGTVVNANG